MIDFDCIATMLCSTLSRINMITANLPDELQDEMNEVKFNIICVLREYKYTVNMANISNKYYLNTESLYRELNIISRDLGIAFLLVSYNEALEDAVYGISFIIKTMSEIDKDFAICYDNALKRVLK